MTEEQKTEASEEDQDQQGDGTDDETEKAKEEVRQLEEEGPPEKLEDWPTGKAKYETYGGPEGEHPYHEGPEQQLGPADTRHREDGEVEIEGEEVEDSDEYKGEPIPGGPTDPDTPNLRMDKASPAESSQTDEEPDDDEEESGSDEEDSGGDREE